MTERGFDTGYWTRNQEIPWQAKYLDIYLNTNQHCNQAGCYQITFKTINFETDLPVKDIPELLHQLNDKVVWYSEHELVWCKDFIHSQAKSSKFIAAAAKILAKQVPQLIRDEILDYYEKKYSISIPYQKYIDTLSIAYRYTQDTLSISPVSVSSSSSSSSSVKKIEGVQGEEEKKEDDWSSYLSAFEEGFGRIGTPHDADKLKDIVDNYPLDWFILAIGEMKKAKSTSISYVIKTLENWKEVGAPILRKDNHRGAYKQDSGQDFGTDALKKGVGVPLTGK
jgi:hypothetical protein